jgi:hypothetical protein
LIVPCSDKATHLDRHAQPDKAHTPWGGFDESAWSMPFWDLDTAMASLLILQVSAYRRNLLTYPDRVKVRWVTPLGVETASTS